MSGTDQKTPHELRRVMLRAERSDELVIEQHKSWSSDVPFPLEATVARRQETYFGPKLILSVDDEDAVRGHANYMLTAPGPQSHLLLWRPDDVSEDGLRGGWAKVGSVDAEIVGTKQYDICSQCGEPIKTVEHERESALGVCTDA